MEKRILLTLVMLGSLAASSTAQAPPAVSPDRQGVLSALDNAAAIGETTAPIAIVELSDYQCPYCGQHANQTLPQIITDYVKTGKVRYFFKDMPNEVTHPEALKAAEAARCAGEQGKYWEMHDRLFKNQDYLSPNELSGYASAIGLELSKFRECLDSGKYAAAIRKDVQTALKNGTRGTPTFFIVRLDEQGSVDQTVRTLSGAQPFLRFQLAIDPMLSPPAQPAGAN